MKMEKYNQAIQQWQEAEVEVEKAEDLKFNAVQSLQDMVLPRLEALCKNFPDTFGKRHGERQSLSTASDGYICRIPVAYKGVSVVDGVTEVDAVSFSFEYDDSYDVHHATFDVPLPYLCDDWEETLAKDLAARNEILDAKNAKVVAEKEADERRLFESLKKKYGESRVVPADADLYRQILDSVAHIPT
jgi:hypothetical protein